MAKQLNWSPLAKEELKSLLLSSQQKSGGRQQGRILYRLFQNALHRVTLNPFIGQATEADNIRYVTPHPDYTLFYRHSLQKIDVLVIWHNQYKAGTIKTVTKED
ncbi:MAG: type II toxin-antitoxin system RelE/ParE family toxin [Bacteroides sp.]|nr:type II toxin-antitoxin system RelE/ParE family toxin [Bacteroides sp.]